MIRVAPVPAFVVGVHAQSLPADTDLFPILHTLADTVRSLPGTVLRIDVHDEIFDPDGGRYDPEAGERLLRYRELPSVDVRVHPRFSDDELWQYLSRLSVAVLPYRFGTHSDWLEACFDLGTAVVVPNRGVHSCNEETFDPGSLTQEIRELYYSSNFPT